MNIKIETIVLLSIAVLLTYFGHRDAALLTFAAAAFFLWSALVNFESS